MATTISDAWTLRFPHRVTYWRLKTRVLTLPPRPKLMGIVNVTPDSFSDGGRFVDPAAAVDHALALVGDGADILDIGGESTRPYAEPISATEELRRVLPVIQRLTQQTSTPVSIDTSKAIVAREALAAGAEIINDVTALTGDPQMLSVALESQCGMCAMHMQGTPQTMQINPHYVDVAGDILTYLRRRRDELLNAGVLPDRLALDPGVGFGKTHQHNLELTAQCHRFHALGQPVLVGHSRKGFIGKLIGDKTADRTAGTLGVSLALAAQGVQILRVHDVRPTHDALLLFEAVGGITGHATHLPADADTTQRSK